MKNFFLFLLTLLFLSACDYKKIPIDNPGEPVTFNKTITGTAGRSYFPWNILQTPDSGFVLAGFSEGSSDRQAFILRLDAAGNTVFAVQDFGGPYHDEAKAVASTSDGSFLLCGYTQRDKPGGGGIDVQVYVVKFDAQGTKTWEKNFGAADKNESAFGIIPLSGGQYLIGYSYPPLNAIRLLRIDADGNALSDVAVNTLNQFPPIQMIATSDGNIALVGSDNTNSMNLVKTKTDGTPIWSYPANPTQNPSYAPGNGVAEVAGNKLFVAGYLPQTINDFSLQAFTETGAELWPQAQSWGYGNDDELFAIAETSDHELAVLGFSSSFTGRPVLYLAKRKAADGSAIWEGPRDSAGMLNIEISALWGDLEACSDGGFVLCAARETDGAIVVVRTDKEGMVK